MPQRRDSPGHSQPLDIGRRRRSDAEQNRAAILETVGRLLADRPLESLTVDEIVAATGVGKGTFFRAFGDKSGLAVALVDEAERSLQQAVLNGAPPLGPGAGDRDRLAAFIDAYIELLADAAHLLVVVDHSSPSARFGTGAYAFWHTHVRALVARLGVSGDPDLVAHCILASLAPDLYLHLRQIGVASELWSDAVRSFVSEALRVV